MRVASFAEKWRLKWERAAHWAFKRLPNSLPNEIARRFCTLALLAVPDSKFVVYDKDLMLLSSTKQLETYKHWTEDDPKFVEAPAFLDSLITTLYNMFCVLSET